MITLNDVIFVLVATVATVSFVYLSLTLGTAYSVGNKYRIKGNKGHKNNFFERLHDGLKTLKRM